MDEKELFENLDGMDIPQSAKNKVRNMLKKKQKKTENMADMKELAKLIAMELKEIIPDGKKWLEAIKELEVKSPKVEVNIPEFKIPEIKAPDVKMPAINIPKQEAPIVNIPKIEIPKIELPKIEIPKQEIIIPKEMEVKGMADYFKKLEKSIGSIIKNKLSVVLHGGIDNTGTVERDNPIPVIPVDENGKVIKGGGGINQVRSGGDLTSYLSDMKIALNKLLFHDGHLKTLEFIDSVGHGTTNTSIKPECAIGKKSAITTGAYTLLESADFVQPAGDTQMYLQSTDAQDSAAGTGIQEITIEYFSEAWGARKTVKVIPDGANQVTISVADIFRIHRIYGNDGHPAAGNITITNQAGDILYGGIDQYETFMRRCVFYIAQDERVTVTQFIVGSTTSGGVNVVAFATHEDDEGNLITRGCTTVEVANNTAIGEFKPWITISNESNVRKSVGLAVNGNSPAQKCTGTLKGFLEQLT